jgi:hypothetical protein
MKNLYDRVEYARTAWDLHLKNIHAEAARADDATPSHWAVGQAAALEGMAHTLRLLAERWDFEVRNSSGAHGPGHSGVA